MLSKPVCSHCDDTGWVCEAHPDRPWEGARACGCGGAGDPCPDCNSSDEEHPPRMPPGFKADYDKDGWRH
jgi:hypothetical protein